MLCKIIRKLAQEIVENENEKIKAIKMLLTRNTKDSTISEELKILLSDQGVNIINQDIATLWETQANMSQKLSSLGLTASQDQKKLISEIFELSDFLKKTSAKAIAEIEDERKKLIVIQEVFRKKTSEKVFNKSFRDKSFKLALEELLDEKSGIAPKKKIKAFLEPAIEEDEGDCTKFFSILEFKEELETVKNSFIPGSCFLKPQGKPETEVVITENKITPMVNELKKQITLTGVATQLHALKKKLIEKNECFKLYPVVSTEKVRNQLPVLRDHNIKINVWGILKENIGKDLTKITMPVYLNEPQTFLQKIAEKMEYSEFLKRANNCPDRFLRLIYVVVPFYMNATNTPNRMKKPFNPLLGETFEYLLGDLKCILEQVSHHPPIAAFHYDSDDFEVNGNIQMKSKLSISGFEFFLFGTTEIRLKKTNEIFVMTKTNNASLHNYIIGKMYIWNNGDLQFFNKSTGDEVRITFKPKGWTSKNDYEVEGYVKDQAGDVKYYLFGRWDLFLSAINSETKEEIKIATRYESPKDNELQYLFPKFTINLNHLNVETLQKAAPTDSRFRPDQRAYEYGNIELASTEKNRLEENQRKRRKENEVRGITWKPIWFEFNMNGEDFTSKYKGGYFECRENNKWPEETLDLYND